MISFYSSLSKKIESFKPIQEKRVKMYHCGPTVYDFVHIGNLRSFLLADLLRRSFEYLGFEVTQVMNITDIGHLSGDNDDGEDKMTKALKREGKPLTLEAMREVADFYTARFEEDIERLNILHPHKLPRASDHIAEDVELINTLEDKGFTYKTSDGLYFDTSKDPHYGKLGGTTEDGQSRIGENNEKRNSRDFALWKFNADIGYPSPWGQGFPGWHIECSAMSQKYLGPTFDIHTGGIDLLPIHHNNEIAQSENACSPFEASAKEGGCEFAHYWLHNEFVNLSGDPEGQANGAKKMAKSAGNIINLKDIEDKGFSPLAYRYFLLLSHYRAPTNFSFEALEAAQNAYRKLKEFVSGQNFGKQSRFEKDPRTLSTKVLQSEFQNAIENDLNTPEALAVVWKLVKDEAIPIADRRATLLDFDRVLGLSLNENEFEIKEIPEEVQKLLDEREQARTAKDFAKSDELREQIKSLGFEVKDTEKGQELSRL